MLHCTNQRFGYRYGDNWRICLTSEAAARELAEVEAIETAQLAQERALAEEEARIAAEEERARNMVYDNKPFVAKPYESATSAETEGEVAALNIAPERRPFTFRIVRCRSSIGHRCSFGDREADNEKYLEHRAQKNPDFELQRREREIGFQASPAKVAASTQTSWYRPTNRATQYETITSSILERARVDAARPAAGAFATSLLPSMPMKAQSAINLINGSVFATAENCENGTLKLANFLADVRPMVEEMLQQNEIVDIFSDVFEGMIDDDIAFGSDKAENELKELRTFNDIVYSKNMSLAAIDWHPTQKGMLAVAPTRNLNFEERTAISGQASNSYILLWDFVDLIHPQLLLESPQEITCFKFNTNQPNFVVAGASNGQVVLWDIKTAISTLIRRQHRSSVGRGAAEAAEASADFESGTTQPTVAPEAISHIDQTHRRVVADLCWLPANAQVNYRGELLDSASSSPRESSHQFLTVSGDGQVMIWDVRYKDIAEGKLPHIGRKLANAATPSEPIKTGSYGKDSKTQTAIPWYPLFKMQLKRLEGAGELSLCRVCHGVGGGSAVDRRSQFFCSSEEGEIVFADWRARASTAPTGTKADDEGDDADAPDYVQWMSPDHSRPAVALELSPFFSDLVLSIGDWSFQLWRLGHQRPIYTSPQASSSLTCGCWSPTRPGTLYAARADGALDVWDFTDSSYRPSVQLMVAPTRITSIRFLTSNTHSKQQLLGVGDRSGNLHVFEMPRNLARPTHNETTLMDNFVNGEVDRIEYIEKRCGVRKEQANDVEPAPPSSPGSPLLSGGTLSSPGPDKAGNTSTAHKDDLEFTPEDLAKINAAYDIQQAQFAEMMGITMDAANRPIKSADVSVHVQ